MRVRLRELPIVLVAPLGLAAALTAHALLQAIADFDPGARGFASHAHTAVAPVLFVEIALTLCLSGLALRDASTSRKQPHYTLTSRPHLGISRLAMCAGLLAIVAIATLFGMEYSESGSAALGLGWLGGALVPGAIALLIGIAMAVATLYLTLAGHLAGFEHLIALFAAALARFITTLLAPAPAPQRISAHPLTARMAPVARHAGLRAPPLTTR